MNLVVRHIEKYFGKIDKVWEDRNPFGPKVDIGIIKPTEENDFYTLITLGMSKHTMDVPYEFRGINLEYAELMITLPNGWQLYDSDPIWSWPINLLKKIIYIATKRGGWIAWGQTVDNQIPYNNMTDLSAAILVEPQMSTDESIVMPLENGNEVNFYQIVPIYIEELEHKQKYGAEALISIMDKVSHIVNPVRYSALGEMKYSEVLDDGIWHYGNMNRKEIKLNRMVAFNHMAIYLRWAKKRNLWSEKLNKKYDDYVLAHNDLKDEDLRIFIYKKLKGVMLLSYFTDEAREFSKYYYGDSQDIYYPMDIDKHAYDYFGEEKYNCEEFKDEAYLFVPFDEQYYLEMEEVLDKRFSQWKNIKKESQ